MEDIEMTEGNHRRFKWLRSSAFKIYSSHALSSWGDRMWNFALGIYLYYINPKSLQLTAVYGSSSCISIILLGAIIGRWIDRMERITAAQVALIVQNTAVITCAVLLIAKIYFAAKIELIFDGTLEVLFIVVIILFGVIADLGSVATKIALEKDWIVVVAQGDEDLLARMNSVMRTIDLTTSILAPITVGQILQFAGKIYGATFIAGWNLASVFVEYYLLIALYKQMPQLRKKLKRNEFSQRSPPSSTKAHSTNDGSSSKEYRVHARERPADQDVTNSDMKADSIGEEVHVGNHSDASVSASEVQVNSLKQNATEESKRGTSYSSLHETHQLQHELVKEGYWTQIKQRLTDTKRGWRDYFGHHVRDAFLRLALLYMTVLGFDNITRNYALNQGVSESYLGIFTAVGAVFGILGSISFPYLRKAFGELTTGNIGFGSETLCLLACIVSIFAPGSPYVHYNTSVPRTATNVTASDETYTFAELWNERTSVMLLLSGIILARFGLWVADLTVSQIFQENIVENKRGVLHGVQGSLNQGMNLIKFTLVIVLPNPTTFAYLIITSWLSVLLGWILFMKFTCHAKTINRLTPLSKVVSSSIVSIKTHDSKDKIDEAADSTILESV